MKIGIDLGDTVFKRSLPRIRFGRSEVMQLFPGCHGILAGHVQAKDELFVISKIGAEFGIDIHIDDRVEVLNSMHDAGIRYNILFIVGKSC